MSAPSFDPNNLLLGVPPDVLHKILNQACSGRVDTPLDNAHSNIWEVISNYLADLKTVGVLRLVNKGHPYRTHYAPNRLEYYKHTMRFWGLLQLASFQHTLLESEFPPDPVWRQKLFRRTLYLALDKARSYRTMVLAHNVQAHALINLAGEDPDAWKKALVALKEGMRQFSVL